jgi:hypothetical protein
MKKFLGMAGLSVALLLAGCGDSQASKIDEALAAKFDKNLCLTELKQFPYVARPVPREWLKPVVDAGLLHMEERDSPFKSVKEKQYVYTLTEKGLKASTEDGPLCWGKQSYVRTEGLVEPENGFQPGQQVAVKVVVKREVTESWAKEDVLKKKTQTGEMVYNAVLTFKDDGSVSVFK